MGPRRANVFVVVLMDLLLSLYVGMGGAMTVDIVWGVQGLLAGVLRLSLDLSMRTIGHVSRRWASRVSAGVGMVTSVNVAFVTDRPLVCGSLLTRVCFCPGLVSRRLGE